MLQMSSVPNYATADLPAPRRINFRIILFAAIVLLLVGAPVYLYVDSVISRGVKEIVVGFKQVDLYAMNNFALDQANGTIDDIPKKWRDLDGQRVVVYGEMWRPLTADDGRVGSFELCYSIAKCCFS